MVNEYQRLVAFEAYALELAGDPATSTKPAQDALKAVFLARGSVAVSFQSGWLGATGHMNPFKKSRFVNGKEPYVVFHAWDPELLKLRRVRLYLPRNLKPHEASRWRKSTMYAIDHVLNGGMAFIPAPKGWPSWLPYKEEEKRPIRPRVKPKTLVEALQSAAEIKGLEVRPRTRETYSNTVRRLVEWLGESGNMGLMPREFNATHVLLFSHWMLGVRRVTAVTRNNYFQTLRSVFGHVVRLGHIEKNPLSNFARIPQDKTARNTAMDAGQLSQLIEWMRENDPVLHLFCRMIYWTFARPVELARLRIRDLDPATGVILFQASITKTRVAGAIRLPNPGRLMLAEYLGGEGGKHDPLHHIFTANGVPGATQVGENTFGHRHMKALQACGLNGKGITLYSWKHTGVCAAYDAGMDLFEIKERCRHASISMTEVYLRDLGKWRQREQMSW